VLTAIGVDSDYINVAIRISLSESNTLEACEVVAKAIKEEVAKLREVSPTWKGE
jgi:cysteine sulfinate desulfinase/cysteine desulfurase-like protein